MHGQSTSLPARAAQILSHVDAGLLEHAAHELGEAKLFVLLPIPIRRKVEQAAKALFALAQRLLGARRKLKLTHIIHGDLRNPLVMETMEVIRQVDKKPECKKGDLCTT